MRGFAKCAGGAVLLLHDGDTFSDDLLGNLTRGEAAIRLLNEVGYHVAALGNRDFDYGAEPTRELQDIARFPMRGDNVIERSTGRPFFGDPTTVMEVGGLRVGLLALGYHHTAFCASATEASRRSGGAYPLSRSLSSGSKDRLVEELRAPYRDQLEAVIEPSRSRPEEPSVPVPPAQLS